MSVALSASRLRLSLFVALPLLCGGVALWSGMDAGWDLRNYHYYNGWAFLHGLVGRDLLVAQTPSFYNPLLDLPYAWAAGWMDARLLAFLLGALHGGNFILLTLLGERLLAEALPPRWRTWMALLLAAAGCAGAVALSEIGTVFYDNVTSWGLFATLLLLARWWPRLSEGDHRAAFLAALPLGLVFGLKQTMAIYAIGLCPALLLTLPAPPRRRLTIAFAFGLGIVAGLLATGGFWMLHLWHSYGNPTFPYFNQLFHSPWGLNSDYRDPAFEPKSPAHWLLFPLYFALDSRIACEVSFFDLRLPLLFLLVPAALPLVWRRRPQVALICLALAITYVVWIRLFAIYRYLVAVEMLAPLLAAAIIGSLPARRRLPAMLALTALLVATTRPAHWLRVPFQPRAVAVELPALADPDHSIVLLAGHEPLSFLIPAFPRSVRFLRIDGTFTNPEQTTVPFNRLMQDIIDRHDGPLLALFIPIERHDVVKRLGNDGLRLLADRCGSVTSPIGAGDYQLCAVERQ
jgi:hypothetical protein